jgi:tetratricopeptide (TPR) repeat protein
VPADASQLLREAAALHQQGRVREAERLYRTVAKAHPSNPEVLRLHGRALFDLGEHAQGIALLRRAAAVAPRDARYHRFLGQTLREAGRLHEAMQAFEHAASLDSRDPSSAADLGRARLEFGDLPGAIDSLQRAHALAPDDLDIRYLLGAAKLRSGEIPADTSHFRALVAAKPDSPRYLTALGFALARNNEFTEAERCYRAALAIDSDFDDAIGGLAQTLESTRRTGEARELLDAAMARGRGTYTVAMALARVCKRQERPRDAMLPLRRLIDSGSLPTFETMSALFRLGDLLEDAGEYDEAWECYRRANAAHGPKWDRHAHRKFVDSILRAYEPGTVASMPRSTNASDAPVFIVGMFRSGTSLTDQILCCHPSIAGAGELVEIHNLAMTLHRRLNASQTYPKAALKAPRGHLDEWAGEYLARLHRGVPADAVRIIDKNPLNYLHLGFIAQLFPKARVIHVSRNPLDTCVSCYANAFTDAHAYTRDLNDLAAAYVECERLMSHWKRVLDLPMHEVRYEDLVRDQERVTRGVLEFLGLPWDAACLKFHESQRVLQTLSVDQIRRPMYTSSIDRHKRFEKHLDPLKNGLAGLLGD